MLGRMATEVARVLRGKHKPTYTPHIDTGDHVVIINADKVVLTAGKAEAKQIYRHTGLPGRHPLAPPTPTSWPTSPRRPCVARSGACSPRTASVVRCCKKLKVYAGPTHPHRRPAARSPSTSNDARGAFVTEITCP